MKLNVRTTNAQLGIKTHNAQIKLQQPKGTQSIVQDKAQLEIKTEKPRVIIDQYQCFAECGLKNFRDLTADNAQYAKQKAIEGIQRRVSDGNRMADIKKGMPEAITAIAKKNYYGPPKQFNMVTMPKSRPKIDVEGSIQINWNLGGARIDYQVNKPTLDYTAGKVELYMQQKNDIDIQWIDERK